MLVTSPQSRACHSPSPPSTAESAPSTRPGPRCSPLPSAAPPPRCTRGLHPASLPQVAHGELQYLCFLQLRVPEVLQTGGEGAKTEGWGERGKVAGGRKEGGVQGLGVPPDRVCALTAERAPECGVETTENGPHPPCEEAVRPEGRTPTPLGRRAFKVANPVGEMNHPAGCWGRRGQAEEEVADPEVETDPPWREMYRARCETYRPERRPRRSRSGSKKGSGRGFPGRGSGEGASGPGSPMQPAFVPTQVGSPGTRGRGAWGSGRTDLVPGPLQQQQPQLL